MSNSIAFDLGQRVKFPSYAEYQAVVIEINGSVASGVMVILRYLDSEGLLQEASVTHDDLVEANPPPKPEPQMERATVLLAPKRKKQVRKSKRK